MPTTAEIVDAIVAAATWDARIALIRRVPETFGTSQHAEVYSAIASRVYAPSIEPDFAYVHWRDDYELAPLEAAYGLAHSGTAGFSAVSRQDLTRLITDHPETLRVFRLLLGLIQAEFSEACSMVADQFGLTRVSKSSIKAIEGGARCTEERAATCATVIDLAMAGQLFPPAPSGSSRSRFPK